jgi:hypothetical protein
LSIACRTRVGSPISGPGRGCTSLSSRRPFSRACSLDHLDDAREESGQVNRRFIEDQLADLDLRQVEDTIDEAAQVLCGLVHLLQPV